MDISNRQEKGRDVCAYIYGKGPSAVQCRVPFHSIQFSSQVFLTEGRVAIKSEEYALKFVRQIWTCLTWKGRWTGKNGDLQPNSDFLMEAGINKLVWSLLLSHYFQREAGILDSETLLWIHHYTNIQLIFSHATFGVEFVKIIQTSLLSLDVLNLNKPSKLWNIYGVVIWWHCT